jgi:PAS domain S-box-containing protein
MSFDDVPVPVWIYDPDTLAILAANKAATEVYGYTETEVPSLTLKDLRPPEDIPGFLAHVEKTGSDTPMGKRPVSQGVWRHRKKDGTVLWVQVLRGHTLFQGREAALVLIHDVTEQRRLEDQFREMHKLESVGRLAGAIAHDFNNLLTVIKGYAELSSRGLDEADPLCDYLKEIRKAGERASSLTSQLLTVSRKQIREPQALDLNAVVLEMETMLRRILGENVELTATYNSKSACILADCGQLHQVLMNLCVNARDAMPDGGRLALATESTQIDAEGAAQCGGLDPGGYILLTLSDTGIGMTEDVRSHIFEPFFTTKVRGMGTGLGLATVYGIMRQSGGWIHVDSSPGAGTRIRLYFPEVEAPPVPEGEAPTPFESRGSETVLLVEDMEEVRRFVAILLGELGYRVVQAADGKAALREFEALEGKIDLLLSDIMMPGMTGKALSELLTHARPGIKVLLMSGYAEEAIAREMENCEGVGFIAKPFSPKELAVKIREMLDSASL